MPNPTAISNALRRSGAGWSLMLAEIAPSVAGCPAPKPNRAEAIRLTAITPAATLIPLRTCWPTSSFSSAGERSQLRMGEGGAPIQGGTSRHPNEGSPESLGAAGISSPACGSGRMLRIRLEKVARSAG